VSYEIPLRPTHPPRALQVDRVLPREMIAADLEGELERLHPASFSWALNCCGRNREDAEEVLQTCYVKILEGRARFDGRSSFKTFLFGVIRKTAAESRRRNILRVSKLANLFLQHRTVPSPADPEEAASRSEDVSRLRRALARLARRQREVVELVFGQELTLEEAARVLGISVGSARSHYHRAKKRLANAFEVEL
jgi:RNA polymerase sigma factor (sigma-70 family)